MLIEVVMSILINWVKDKEYFDVNQFEVEVVELSSEEIQKKACGGKCPIIGFFKKDEGIFIQKMDYKNNLCNQSILLHELVHALQDFSDSKMNIAFREKEAYEIQNRFLIEKSIEKKLFKTLNLRICRWSQSLKKK